MNNLVITRLGQELVAEILASENTIKFTKIVLTDHRYDESEIYNLVGIFYPRQTNEVDRVGAFDAVTVKVVASMDNQDVTSGYYIRAVGLYCEDKNGTEVLFGVSIDNDNPDYMPAYNNKTVSGVNYTFNVKVERADSVVVSVDPSTAASRDEVTFVDNKLETHKSSQVMSDAGVHGIRYVNETMQVLNADGEWIDAASKVKEIRLTETLSQGNTTVTFTNEALTQDALIDVYASKFLSYNDISLSDNTLTITFDAQSEDVTVEIVIK